MSKYLRAHRVKRRFRVNDIRKPFNGVGLLVLVLFLVSCASKSEPQREIRNAPLDVVPADWIPSLEQAQLYLEEASESRVNRSQNALTRSSQSMADVADAQLFITYVLLMQRLDENNRAQLFNEQKSWLAQRPESARAAIASKGGSIEPLEYADSFRSITEKRQAELQARLNQAQ